MAVILLSSIVIKFLTKVDWLLFLFVSVMVRIMFLSMHASWPPYYVSGWFRQLLFSCRVVSDFDMAKLMIPTLCLILPDPVRDELFGICFFRRRMLCILIQIVMRVCGTLLTLRDNFSHYPILVSNCLSHTAQFSTRRKVWKRLCSS